MIEKIKTFIWFISRPNTYPFLVQLIKRRLFFQTDDIGKDLAKKEAEKLSNSTNIDLFELFGIVNSKDFYRKYIDQIHEANSIISNLPFVLGGKGDLNFLYNTVLVKKPKKIIETGVAYGWSSFSILSGLSENGYGHLISIDMPYPKLNNENYVGVAIPEILKKNWTLIRKPDRNGLIDALKSFNDSIDLCHYDSDKSYTGRWWAYPKLWKALTPEGVFISDDIQDNMAFFEFCRSVNIEPFIVKCDNKFVGVLTKPNE